MEVLPSAPSTNALLAQRAREGAPGGLVLVTEHQTGGRGRLDRTWQTPAGSALTFSVLLRPQVPPGRWPWLPLLTGLAVRGGLADCGVAAGLKWPNDVLVGGRKIAGILAERVESDHGPAAILGMGINVEMSAEELPVPTATSLRVEGNDTDREELLVAIVDRLNDLLPLLPEPADPLRRQYQEACVTLGLTVRAELPAGRELTGVATGVDESGRLLVDPGTGAVPIAAGDVVHLRNGGVTTA